MKPKPQMEPLRPWHRVPPWYICRRCGAAATGFWTNPGEVYLYCADHEATVTDELMERHGVAVGFSRVRHPWSFVLGNAAWRLKMRTIHRREWRRRRAEATEEERRLDEMFGTGSSWRPRQAHLADILRQSELSASLDK